MGPPTSNDSLKVLLRSISHQRSRQVLAFIDESDVRTADVDMLTRYIVTQDGRTPDPDQITVELHHFVLPEMADARLIDYDSDAGIVRYRKDALLKNVLSHLAEFREAASCGG